MAEAFPEGTPIDTAEFLAATAAEATKSVKMAGLVYEAQRFLDLATELCDQMPQSFTPPEGYLFAFRPAETDVIPETATMGSHAGYMELDPNRRQSPDALYTTGRFVAHVLGLEEGVLMGFDPDTRTTVPVPQPFGEHLDLVAINPPQL